MIENYDLCMLEHLSYMNVDDGLKQYIKSGKRYKSLEECDTVGDYLDQFDTTELRKHSSEYTNGDSISCDEYAAIIEYMKNNNGLRTLVVNKKNSQKGRPLAYDFEHGDEHIVIFKGTTGGKEWKDNVEGVGVADTQSQIEAKNFIDEIDSNNITVVGHSKGGNKAMYCAVVCDKVKRCVSMDGQGFSDEFMEKYRYQIAKKAGIISNISYCSDFVHGLMIQIPGTNQVYTGNGYGSNGVNSAAECHSPNSLFTYSVDENGKLIVTGSFDVGKETKSVQIINGLTEYIMHSDCEDKEGLIAYLAEIVGKVGENKDVFLDRLFNGEEKIDTDQLTTLVAYLIKYCNENNVSGVEIATFLCDIHVIEKKDRVLWGTVADLILLWVKSNEKSQNYILLKVLALLYPYLNFRISAYYLITKKKDISKEEKVIHSLIVKVLFKIKGKYNSINYDASKKNAISTERMKPVSTTSDFHETTSAGLYYKPERIQSAVSKMKEIISREMVMSPAIQTSLSGNALDTFVALNKLYDDLYTDIYDLINSTQQKVSTVLDAVNALESQ